MKFNIQFDTQPIAVRMLALALATLLTILVIGGIRAIARVDATDAEHSTPPQVQDAVTPLNEWDSPIVQTSPSVAPSSPSATPSASPTPAASPPTSASPTPASYPNYTPPQETAAADSSNYGDRYATDIFGVPVENDWLIVLHETVGTADSAIRTFQTPHPNEDDQVSYHTVIRRNGTVVYIVPPEKRAFGAGNSVFSNGSGSEAVRTDPKFPPSVNNFAYHISLETPPDGHNDASSHSGYSREQYQSLAWLIARTSVPENRITTHQAIDRSGSRIDPRNFSAQQFLTFLRAYPNRNSVAATSNAAQ